MEKIKRRETAENHCIDCEEMFITLADERDDICGGCHEYNQGMLKRDWLIANCRCPRCEEIPTRSTARTCKVCKEGWDEADLSSHEKG